MKIVLAVLTFLVTPALAQPTIRLVPTCVAIDTEVDQLPETERAAARALLVRELERQEQLIVESGCTETIALSHVRDGANVIVRLRGPRARRKLTVSAREPMTEIYGRMVRSLLAPEPPPPALEPDPAPAAPTPGFETSAVAPEPAPSTVRTGHLWNVHLGFGTIGDVGGAAMTLGYRRLGKRIGLEVALATISGESAAGRARNTRLRVGVLEHREPQQDVSLYYGGGLSLGATTLRDVNEVMEHHQSGFQAEGIVGYALNRTGRTRWFVEANVTLPFYTVDDSYLPLLTVSLGVGR